MMGSEKTYEIGDLKEPMQNINIKGKIVNINLRKVSNERGESVYHYGIIGDSTGTIPFTAWSLSSSLKQGDVVAIRNCSTRDFKGSIRLYLDSSSAVKLLPGEDMEVHRSSASLKIGQLSRSTPYVSVRGKIGKVYEREFEKDGKKTTIYSTSIEDETGRIRLSSFGRPLEEGSEIEIQGARVSEYNGSLRISVNENSQVSKVNLGLKIGERYHDIGTISSPVGGISIRAVCISMGEKSGLIYRCSECNKRVDEIRCNDHPDAPIKYDIFAYFTMDDGTGTIQASAGSRAMLEILGIKEEEFTPQNRAINKNMIRDRIHEKMLGHAFKISGDVREQNVGLSLRGFSISQISDQDISAMTLEQEADFQ